MRIKHEFEQIGFGWQICSINIYHISRMFFNSRTNPQ